MIFTLSNTKTQKGEAHGWLTAVLHLAPATEAGGRSVCPKSTPECRADCLYTAGRGTFPGVIAARIRRTHEYLANPREFAWRLAEEIDVLHRRAMRQHMRLAVRINGTSDLPALTRTVKGFVGGVQFYDYTKIWGSWNAVPGVHYTFSRSEKNEAQCAAALEDGINVAVVFSTKKGTRLPRSYAIEGRTFPVIDGDLHDLRFLDPRGVIVGLRAKGRARRRDTHGFVVQV